jgi:hypothetical protein
MGIPLLPLMRWFWTPGVFTVPELAVALLWLLATLPPVAAVVFVAQWTFDALANR